MNSIFQDPDKEVNNTEPDEDTTARVRSGANWFYWIAGLSLVNSAIYAFGGDISFILGLAITQLVDGIADVSIAEGAPAGLKFIAVGIDLIIAFVFVLFGYFANKGLAWAFIVGSVIYIFDGLIYLLLDSVFAAAFHAFALFFIVRGFIASRKLRAYNALPVVP
jgi:hypothetical protein